MSTQNRIAELNDRLRQSFLGGRVVMTSGILALSETTQSQIVEAVQGFTAFTEDNDPYEEHDFGVVMVDRLCVNWKIDYYDLTLQYLSEDPANPAITRRVLTIMLADEY